MATKIGRALLGKKGRYDKRSPSFKLVKRRGNVYVRKTRYPKGSKRRVTTRRIG